MSNYTTITYVVLIIVSIISLALAAQLWVASNPVGNPKIRWVSGGFFVLGIKSVVIASVIAFSVLEHELIELVDGVFDLLAVLLVAAPFLMRD